MISETSSQSIIAAAVAEQADTTAEIDRSLTQAVTAVYQLAARDGSTVRTGDPPTRRVSRGEVLERRSFPDGVGRDLDRLPRR